MSKKTVAKRRGGALDLSAVTPEVAKKLGIEPVKEGEEYISPNDIGKMLNVTGEAVKQWIYQRKLPAIKLANGYWKVKVSTLKTFLNHRQDHGCRKIILATEDKAHADIIQGLGHDAIVVGSLPDALLKTASITPALVVIDVDSKSLRPWDLAQKLRAMKQTKNCPILLIGKVMHDQDTAKALSIKAEGFVAPDPKSFKDEIIRIVGA